MNNEIKEILESLDKIANYQYYPEDLLYYENCKLLLDYITTLQQENERLTKQNNDLRKIYRNTYNRLFENGNDELARYFQAQIDECRTFYVEPIIDYHKEWLDYKSRIEKAIDFIKSYNIDFENCKFSEAPISIRELRDLLNILNGKE